MFEWGRPLLGGSSDEEDYGQEDEAETGEDSGRQPLVLESAAPVYLEKEPSEVSIPLQRSVRKIVKPEEVIEEYVDEEGRQVKRISKVTTTKTITRLERRLPTQKMDVDVPSEPGEDVEELIDESGQRVRRVVRTSFTTTPKTVLRDGAVKVVLKPGEHGQRELWEEPEETERIDTFTSYDGRRTQKLSKTSLTTRLKRTVKPVTVQLPSPASLPIHDDQPSMDQDENFNTAIVERNVSYPEWLETVKEKPSTPKEITLSSIQVEPPQPVLPLVHVPERPDIVEELSATIVERHPPTISLMNLEEEKDNPEIRERKRIEPPEGLSGISEIPRKRAHKEPSPTPPAERDADPQVEMDDVHEEDETSEDDKGDEFNEEIVVLEVKRRPRVPKWFVVVPDKPEQPLKADGLDYPKRIASSVSQVEDRTEIKEDAYCINIERKVTIPVLSWFFDNEAQMEVDEVKDDPHQSVKKEARQIEPVEVTFPIVSSEDETPEDVQEYIDENGVRVRRIVRRNITTTTIKRGDQGIERVEIMSPVEPSEDESPEEVEEYVDENGAPVRRIVRRTITTRSIRTSVDEAKDDPDAKTFESAAPVYLDSDEVVPSVQTREVVLPEWMEESEPASEEARQPTEDISFIIVPSQPREPQSKGELDREDVMERVTSTTLNREIVIPEVDRIEDESPVEVEEYVDENGVRVRRVVRRTITTTSVKREGQRTEPVEVKFPVATSEGESPEEVEEYIDENGVRVRRIVKRTVATATIKREGAEIGPVEVKFPATTSKDESPEEVEEYIDENGVRVRRIVRRTITTRSITRTSVDEAKDDPDAKTFESAAPVYLDSDEVVPSMQTREVVLPEWMEESEPALEEPRQPAEDISVLILPSQPKEPGSKEDLDRKDVMERVTSTTLNRAIVMPEIEGIEDESPEDVEEYVDENGVRVRRIVRTTITTTSVKREDQRTEPVEIKFPVSPSEGESPEEFEEYIDENGVRVRRIVKRTITTATIKREGPGIAPEEVTFPVTPSEEESPEEVEEYIDDNGVRVRRIVRRTITTRSIIRTSVDEAKDDPDAKMFESAAPVYLDSDEVVPSVQTREVVLPEWMDESKPASEEPRQPTEAISFVILPSQPRELQSKGDLNREDVMERVTSTTLNREVVIPEIDGMEDQSPAEVEEYVDENGVRVRRIVRRTITTTSVKREGQRTEPVEVKFPVASSEGESPEEVEEYIDENGVRVRRIVKRTITTATIKREGPGIAPEEVTFPLIPPEEESPEEVEEYIDENGVRVRRIVRRTITTRSIIRSSIDEAKDDPGAKMFESAAPVYLDSDEVVPSVQTREVIPPEWMEESEPTSEEPKQPTGDISFVIVPSQPREPRSKGDLDREDVMERVTSTTLNREIVMPEIEEMESESPEDVEEYVDENGIRVRRIVRRTITTTSIKREGQRTEPVEVKFPVASSEGESPEEVEEYIDENGVRVRRIVKRTITTATINREGAE